MEIKQIKELIAAMEKGGLKKMRVKEEKGFEIELERHPEHQSHTQARHEPIPPQFTGPSHSPPINAFEEEKREHAKVGKFVTSPMVGTYYSAPSPDDPIYVKVGDEITEDTVVCIIEAMKVMNEVKAGRKGKVAEILVENAEPVEFGTPLFRVI